MSDNCDICVKFFTYNMDVPFFEHGLAFDNILSICYSALRRKYACHHKFILTEGDFCFFDPELEFKSNARETWCVILGSES